MAELKKTPLYEEHIALGAKMAEFAHFSMPIYYKGILQEHLNVRHGVGIFDICHMGRIWIRGKGAFDFIQEMITNDLRKLKDGKILYTPICREDGGILDDILVYQSRPDEYLLVVNASNIEKDLQWLSLHRTDAVECVNESDESAFLAVQGPLSGLVMSRIFDDTLVQIPYYHFVKRSWRDVSVLISRTGYTGEDGFEFCLPGESAIDFWREILKSGHSEGVVPIGLGARDTLRLEMRYLLYGNDMDESVSPLEAGLGWTVSFSKGNFMGRSALEKIRQGGLPRRLVGFEMIDQAIPRHGNEIIRDGQVVGKVASGSYSPTLKKNIGLAYIDLVYAHVGVPIYVSIRGQEKLGEIVKTPFFQGGHSSIARVKARKSELLNSGI